MKTEMKTTNTSEGKKRHILWRFLLIFAALILGLFFLLMTHTQLIVGAVQTLAQQTVNTKNLYEPLNAPVEGVRENGQYIITELRYTEAYPNSFLNITYPDANTETPRPTLIYFHGGGYFGGSKSVGDPLAGNDATSMLDDLCAEGFNLVNVDYALVPDYHFPVPLIQANEALRFLTAHAAEYHLDMERLVIMGSSAGAIMAAQLGGIITNPAYAGALGIVPAVKPEQVKALVIDDAPLDYDRFSLGTKVLVGNYVRGSVFLSREQVRQYNSILWIDAGYPPCVLLGSEYISDMRSMAEALQTASVQYELIDPLAELGIQKQHCFVAAERTDEVARDAFLRMVEFIRPAQA